MRNSISFDDMYADSYAEDAKHTAGLRIKLLKQTYVFPWSQFLFAEGGNDEIRIAFSTHDVVVKGGKLEKLLSEITAQKVNLLKMPSRAESFAPTSEPHIAEILVSKAE
jgi:hypothetical protein